MKIAITVIKHNGRISPLFEASGHALILQCCKKKFTLTGELNLPDSEDAKRYLLQENQIDGLICGAIANETVDKLKKSGIEVCAFATGVWQDVCEDFLEKNHILQPGHTLPGCQCQHRKCCIKTHKIKD